MASGMVAKVIPSKEVGEGDRGRGTPTSRPPPVPLTLRMLDRFLLVTGGVMTDSATGSPSSSPPQPSQPPLLAWPPPGLESLHARIWPIILTFALGDVVLIWPLLWSVGSERGAWSLGPFGQSWWVLLVSSALGLLVFLFGFEMLTKLLFRATRASKRGHNRGTILEVITDGPRDTGFVLQGARLYRHVTPGQRDTVLATRVVGTLAFLAAVLWVPFGFAFSVVLAARGVLSPAMVSIVTVVIPLGFVAIGLGGALQDAAVRRSARRDGEARATADEELRAQIGQWNVGIAAARRGIRFHAGSRPAPGEFRWALIATIVVAAGILIPTATLAFTSALGPIVASIAVPSFSRLQARIAVADALRRERLEPDPAITAEAAGQALHNLIWLNRPSEPGFDELGPVTVYDDPWFPPELDSLANVDSLFDKLAGMNRDQRAALRVIASHPAHSEWEVVGRAAAADIVSARYNLPLPDSASPITLSIPRFSHIRRGAQAHVAKAAVEFLDGRPEMAEQTIREVLTTGFLLIDEGPTLIDNLIGTVMVRRAGTALEGLYRASGRTSDAAALAWVLESVKHVETLSDIRGVSDNFGDLLRAFPRIALDTTAVRGLRWEAFLGANAFARCFNLYDVVFGPGEDYDRWLDEARASLVRRPSDEALFDFFQYGWFGQQARTEGGLLAMALRVVFGKGGAAETCGGELGYW